MPDVFTCQRCGHCCQGEGGIVLSRRDRERLAGHLGMPVEELLRRCAYEKDGKHFLKSGPDGYCMFYDQGCGVHPGRPDVCRAWPFFRGNLLDELSFAMAREDCPGISPDAAHAEFRRHGLNLLREQGLCDNDEAAGRALSVEAIDPD